MSIRLSLLAALCAALSAAPGGICAPGSEADSGGGRTMGEMLRALERERELARKELGEGPETGGNAAVLPQNFSDFEIEMDRFAAEREAALAEIAARLAARPKLAVAEPGSPAPEAAGMSDEALKKMKSVLEEEIKNQRPTSRSIPSPRPNSSTRHSRPIRPSQYFQRTTRPATSRWPSPRMLTRRSPSASAPEPRLQSPWKSTCCRRAMRNLTGIFLKT